MSLWKAIKDWIGITSAKEIADLKEAEKKAASVADAAIKQSLENIEALGQKIEAEIEPVEEIKQLLRFVKASERGLIKGARLPNGDGE